MTENLLRENYEIMILFILLYERHKFRVEFQSL